MRMLFRADDLQLLRNISNWLKGAAGDWYLQLSQGHHLPDTWHEFKKLFLSHFRSAERVEALKIERCRCVQEENETAADFYQRYLGLNLEINPKPKENLLQKYFLRKLRRWISTNSVYDKDEGNPQEFTTSLTRQLVRLKTPERTVVVANLDAPSSSSTNSSGQETQTDKSPAFPTNNDRNRPAFLQNRQTNFYERNNNNSGGQNSNNNSPRLPFSSNNSLNLNRSNPSAANHNREPSGPCQFVVKMDIGEEIADIADEFADSTDQIAKWGFVSKLDERVLTADLQPIIEWWKNNISNNNVLQDQFIQPIAISEQSPSSMVDKPDYFSRPPPYTSLQNTVIGQLIISVQRAHGPDGSRFSFKNNPFAVIECNHQRYATNVHDKGRKSPMWAIDGPFSFNIYTTGDKVNMWVLDKNVLRNRDKLLGSSKVSVKFLLDQDQDQLEK
ncbi:unnamed protein product [Didymodactylos carnosus]|uniref:C2 domain-containing protein n=1 Tax=Didymodactylos carnosus TaxID=1234261 RepID=A0A8S2F5W6_9BILA|nr:unnamed protein product [Didymodactylos carnosus]CAF4173404.1 unnamed protein product [Didymodactylos carnosus]